MVRVRVRVRVKPGNIASRYRYPGRSEPPGPKETSNQDQIVTKNRISGSIRATGIRGSILDQG